MRGARRAQPALGQGEIEAEASVTEQRHPLPNLFGQETLSVTQALYAVAIPKLLWRGEAREAVRQLRLVRAFGRKRKVASRHTAWTRGFELEALVALGQGEAAWRVAQAHLREGYPKWAKKPLAKRVARMSHFIRYWEMPAAYYSGRLRHATKAMEVYLDWALKHVDAYEMRHDLFNGDDRPNPSMHVRVSLFHLYSDAGRALGDWPLWKTWVDRLHRGLLKLCGLKRKDLAADATLMKTFHERLRVVEKERRPAHVTFGQKDVLEPKRKVLARQHEVRKRIHGEPSPRAVMLAEKRAMYFPWLREKRAGNETQAREARDLSIECMALLDRTVYFVKQLCPEAFFLAYRSACAQLMGEFVDIINRAAFDFPSLKPTDEEWSRVVRKRAGDRLQGDGPVGAQDIRRVLDRVRGRSREVQRVTPRMVGPVSELDAAFESVGRLIERWPS